MPLSLLAARCSVIVPPPPVDLAVRRYDQQRHGGTRTNLSQGEQDLGAPGKSIEVRVVRRD
jgi:hypothetical protein